MNIIFWLKKLVSLIFRQKYADIISDGATTAPSTITVGAPSLAPGTTGSITISTPQKATNEIAKILGEFSRLEKNTKKFLKKISRKIRKVEWLIYFGFFVLLLMVVGLFWGYWQFTYGINREMRDQLIENKIRILEIEKKYDNLAKDNNNLLQIINCQRYKEYWQYEQCFK